MTKTIKTLILITLFSCLKEEAIPITTAFDFEIINNDFTVPVKIVITNNSKGAESYLWTLKGSDLDSLTEISPPIATYDKAGEYIIKLNTSNLDLEKGELEKTFTIYDNINTSFAMEVIDSNYPPIEVIFTNNTVGANRFLWTFEDANIVSTVSQHPDNVVFETPGIHNILLEVGNGMEEYSYTSQVEVLDDIEIGFSHSVAFEDMDYQVPVTINYADESISATGYKWTFEGGEPATSTIANPSVVYSTSGTYTVSLEISNDKKARILSKEVTLLPDTNIYKYNDIKLGINIAHNNNEIGAFFSTITGEVYNKEQVANVDGKLIDICFFGLNSGFSFNQFISPTTVSDFTFYTIEGATYTQFINLQESCLCTASMTISEFDLISDESGFNINIEETFEGLQEFDNNQVPRIVLFKTYDGRKGAIKVKEFVDQGTDSYIVIDIKVQKLQS